LVMVFSRYDMVKFTCLPRKLMCGKGFQGRGSHNYLYKGFTEELSNKLLLIEIMCKTER